MAWPPCREKSVMARMERGVMVERPSVLHSAHLSRSANARWRRAGGGDAGERGPHQLAQARIVQVGERALAVNDNNSFMHESTPSNAAIAPCEQDGRYRARLVPGGGWLRRKRMGGGGAAGLMNVLASADDAHSSLLTLARQPLRGAARPRRQKCKEGGSSCG